MANSIEAKLNVWHLEFQQSYIQLYSNKDVEASIKEK